MESLSQLPKTRQEAMKNRVTTYFTGKPCKAQKHICERLTVNSNCKMCLDQRANDWQRKKQHHVATRERNRRSRDPHTFQRRQFKRLYNLSLERYFELLQEQNNRCAICGMEFKSILIHRDTVVDHDHKTNIVRGILCHPCNAGLGYFHDNINKMQQAIVYLEKASTCL